MSAEEGFYLMHRLAMAAFVLNEASRDAGRYRSLFPDPQNAPEFLRWMLIAVWNKKGTQFLECWAASFLEDQAKGE